MQRTLEITDFELPRGPVSIASLINMPEADWEHLRLQITRQWQLDASRPLARCRLCMGPVYIKVQAVDGRRVPLFAHYKDEGSACPWYQGNALIPDDPRAAQYQGHQETALHRWLCQTIAEVVSKDTRCRDLSVETYLRPSIAARGRFPDVYFELEGLGRFVVEVQLSKPFPTEIAARHIHYEREGVKLIWIFHDLPDDLPQGFRDVIALQRGNAFFFDEAALKASVERDTLVLGCRLQRDGRRFTKERYVTLDELNLSSPRAVFFEDCRSEYLAEYCDKGRTKWRPYLRERLRAEGEFVEDRYWIPAWDSISRLVPTLAEWKGKEHAAGRFDARQRFVELIAILFSIAKSAKTGADELFTSQYKGKGALLAMLNARLSGRHQMPHANLIETMLSRTTMAFLLGKETLTQSLDRAKSAEPHQVTPDHPVWLAAARIFPEVLDGNKRAEMDDLGLLPRWAAPTS